MARKFKSMDGNNAAAYVSYAFTDVAAIYPITPSSPMADYCGPVVRRRPEEHLRQPGQGR
jgi:pyruvate/2-oxoacid:ferredoxin oxidoreductase alpha subunit